MAWAQKKRGGSSGRLAIVLSILALVLAWAAYRRAGGQIGTLWTDLTGGRTASAVERQSELAQARTRLLARRAEVAGRRNLEQVQREVAETRAGLERSYRDASAGAKERWRRLDADLERLQRQLRDGGSKALETLDSALAKIGSEAGDGK